MAAKTPAARGLRKLALLSVTLLVAVGLSGCLPSLPFPGFGAASGPSQQPADRGPVTSGAPAGFESYYEQRIDWTNCDGMQCARIDAPMSWQDPDSEPIKLALIVQPARGKSQGSLLINPGGPGASGVDLVHDSVDYVVGKKLQENFDIVGFDPRGVGRSSAVKCYDGAGMDDFLFEVMKAPEGSAAWVEEIRKHQSDFGRACLANTGELLGHVDTISAAHDLDLMRAVLGNEKLNYLGYSYGTSLGSTYAELFPQNTGRLVLDGAVDPAADVYELNLQQALGFESALRSYLKECLGSRDCPFRGDVESAMAQVGKLLKAVNASPLRASDGRLLDAGALMTAIIYPLYSQEAWWALSTMFGHVMAGSADFAFTLVDAYYSRTGPGTYSDNTTEANIAISCLDYPKEPIDPDSLKAKADALSEAAPTIGPFWGYGELACADWPVDAVGAPGELHAAGAAPLLVIGTTNDPATPYVWAQRMAKQLESAVLVTFEGEGHTAYNGSSRCINDIVDNYFVSGSVPKGSPVC